MGLMECIFDFCGYYEPGHFPVSMSADYDGHKVIFGGDWSDIPNLVIGHEPTEEEILNWISTNT